MGPNPLPVFITGGQLHEHGNALHLSMCLLDFPQFHNLQELRHSASLANKVFIQRDYTEGTTCKFQTKFPSELESRVRGQTLPTAYLFYQIQNLIPLNVAFLSMPTCALVVIRI